MSQSRMGSFNASQSVASTPGATPPRGSQQSMSFSFTNGMGHNSMSRGSFGGYEDTNAYGGMVPYQDEYQPQIYRAVYSNVSVYEMEVNGVAVMKRRSDSWLNATQILKVAGVVKARRTKTLEKEIAAGEHEKVQGGYGKYQGTWVNYQRGVELCREYHVEELLRPLLEYDMGQDGVSSAGQGTLDTPTKEQAMAAQRKRLYSGVDNRGMSQPPQGTFFQNISRTAANAVNAISKARFDSPSARGMDGRRSSMMRKPSHQMGSQESQVFSNSQQSMYSNASDSGFGSNMQHSGRSMGVHGNSGLGQEDSAEPPRKKIRSFSNQGSFLGGNTNADLSMHDATPTEPSDSFYQQMDGSTPVADGQKRGLEPLPPATTPERFQKMKLIMTLFLDKRAKDFSNHPAFLQLSGEDLEIPLDEYRNSALHWAAMLARLPLVYALIEKGVSIYRLNLAGETALQKAVGTRNNLDYRTLPRLLQVLAPTIDMVDYNGRTVLHHIAVMAATGGGGHVSAKHYLEALLEFIVRYGGTALDPRTGMNAAGDKPEKSEVITLGRFISEIVNLRDDQGDTALNLAGRARSVLVPQLLEVGADPHIPNHTGLRPADYGVGVDMVNGSSQSQQNGTNDSFTDQLTKTKKDILDATIDQIRSLVEETLGTVDRDLTSTLSKKQEEFDHWHSKIRESAKARQIEQKQLDDLKQRATGRVELDRRIKNLERSAAELEAMLKNLDGAAFDPSRKIAIGDADMESGLNSAQFDKLFPADFDPASGFSEEQKAFLASLPSVELLKAHVRSYKEHNGEILDEVERLKSKNVVLGQNYRRMVMACTGWSAEQVDEAAEGLTQCVKELNDHPVPEDEAIEILMQDRGQDW
ncbi:transcriptional regulator swi6 [Paecilomyces lecythidis]|uniref:Cell pattern formation-associated protein stuA n=1 Tax=Paecilomyces lecythidis TaxID=3004212 RepID=A0ABR3X0V6_9EURO